jgi:hypothetical protein
VQLLSLVLFFDFQVPLSWIGFKTLQILELDGNTK